MTERLDDAGLDDDGLEGLDSLRQMIGAARASGFDEEPAPRIDAMLMAAARQHAPKPRVAWWARLADWMRPAFAHPALAGAAALVIVGGAAGVMYRRGQHRVVSPTVHVEPTRAHRASAPPPDEAPRLEPPPSFRSATAPDEVMEPELPTPRVEPSRRPPIAGRTTTPGGGRGRNSVVVAGAGQETERLDELQIAEGPIDGIVAEPNQQDRRFDGETDDYAVSDVGGTFSARLGATPNTPPSPPPPDATRNQDKAATATTQQRNVPEAGGGQFAPEASTITSTGSDRGRDQTPRAQAVQLFGQARTAARARNCAVVKVIASRVRKLDAAYYRDVFARDPDVARCL